MPTLKEVLSSDFNKFTKLSKGFLEGMYFPFAVSTFLRRIGRVSDENLPLRFMGLFLGTTFTGVSVLSQCFDRGIHPKYLLSAMALTNLVDYGYSVYKRTKGKQDVRG